MKRYICVNFLQCDYADAQPPIEFELADILDNVCPECGKANIREVITSPPPVQKWVFAIVGVVLLAGLLWAFWPKHDEIKGAEGPISSTIVDSTIVDSTTSLTGTVGGQDDQEKNSVPPKPQPVPVMYTKVEGSEFCVGDCILSYSEVDNLGHIREKRVENYAKCCPAEKE